LHLGLDADVEAVITVVVGSEPFCVYVEDIGGADYSSGRTGGKLEVNLTQHTALYKVNFQALTFRQNMQVRTSPLSVLRRLLHDAAWHIRLSWLLTGFALVS
jgi:hypothetical protein